MPADPDGPPPAAPSSASEVVKHVRAGFEDGLLRDVAARKAQLRQLRRLLVEQEDRLLAALAADMGKPPIEGYADGHRLHDQRDQPPPEAPRPLGAPPVGAAAGGDPPGPGPDPAGAARGGAGDRALELPGPAPAGPGRRGAGRRQRRRPEAERDQRPHRRDPGRAGAPLPRRAGRRRRDRWRRRDDRAAGRAVRPHLLHGERPGRPCRDGGRGQAPHAGHARARRQEPGHRGRRRQPGGDGTTPRVGQVPERRPDLRRPGLRARRPHRGGAAPAGAGGGRRPLLRPRSARVPGLRPDRQRVPLRAADRPARRRRLPRGGRAAANTTAPPATSRRRCSQAWIPAQR